MTDNGQRLADAEIRRLIEMDLEEGLRRFRAGPAVIPGIAAPVELGRERRRPGRRIAALPAIAAAAGLAVLAIGLVWLLRGDGETTAGPASLAEILGRVPAVRELAGAGTAFPGDLPALPPAPQAPLAEIIGRVLRADAAAGSAGRPDLSRLEATPRLGLAEIFKILYGDRAVERVLSRYGRQG